MNNLPICAICKKQVDSIEWYYDNETKCTKYRVYCHNDTEETVLEDEDIQAADCVRPGIAFKQKKIGEGKK